MFYDILLIIFYYLDEYDLLWRINFVKAVRQTGNDSN